MYTRSIWTAAAFVVAVAAGPATAFQCNECHSKNPRMVQMHRALQGRNCFECHEMGKKLMGKVTGAARENPFARRATEAICRECHQSADQPKKQ